MLKMTVKYKDFNDEETEEDLYFNLTEAEVVELETSYKGGLSASMQAFVAAEDLGTIMKVIKEMILLSYGKRSMDGKRFVKTEEMRQEFLSSKAYSKLFMNLVTNEDKQIEFINGIMPAELLERMAEVVRPVVAEVPKPRPEVITKKMITEMTQEQFDALQDRLITGDAVLEP